MRFTTTTENLFLRQHRAATSQIRCRTSHNRVFECDARQEQPRAHHNTDVRLLDLPCAVAYGAVVEYAHADN